MKALFIVLPIIMGLGLGCLAWWLFANCKVTKYRVIEKERAGWNGSIEKYKDNESYYEKDKKRVIGGILSCIGAVICLLVLCIIPGSIHQVEAGQVAVVKVWGDAKEVRIEGIHFDFWISHKYEYYDTKVQQVKVTTQAYSKDAQTMDIELVIQYQIQTDKAMEIAKNYGGLEMLESRIETISIERMKSVVSLKDATSIIETRGTVSHDVTQTISDAITADYYINVQNVVLTDISFSDAFEATVEQKMIAEQEKLKAQYEKEKAVIEAEAAKERAVLQAEADLEKAKKEAEAIIERANAEAQSIELKAQAEAQAIELVEEAWNGMSEDVKEAILKKLAIEQWNGELPNTMVGTDFIEWLLGNI